ncbi:MAG: BrnT family toxin [Deltaproteobacteria bacterium]|nr:MAG: BrnT family toxin [Deltaproteobacteria bacterium]
MNQIKFAWDEEKDKTNKKKHGVSFEEASSVFYDEKAIEYFDPDHSEQEDRFLLLGMSVKLRVLVVCHCVREANTIRIISARKATRSEENNYRE